MTCSVVPDTSETTLMCDIFPVQFEMECRPFYVSGFNAHDLVPKSLATPSEHRTVG